MQAIAGLAVGLIMGEALSGGLSRESQCPRCGRGDELSNNFRRGFDGPQEAEKPEGNNYGEVEISQKKPKKGQKDVPPDVKFKGNLDKLPEILQAAGVKKDDKGDGK
jgi:hypothetical protein